MQLSDVSNNVESIRHLIPNATPTNPITVRDFGAYLAPKVLSFAGLLAEGWPSPATHGGCRASIGLQLAKERRIAWAEFARP